MMPLMVSVAKKSPSLFLLSVLTFCLDFTFIMNHSLTINTLNKSKKMIMNMKMTQNWPGTGRSPEELT